MLLLNVGQARKENITKEERVPQLIEEGDVCYKKGQYEYALLAFDQALLLDDNNVIALRYRGDTYRMLQRYDHAFADLNRSLTLEPDDTFAMRSRDKALRHDSSR